MVELRNVVSAIISLFLTLFYSSLVLIHVLYRFIFQYHTKFWIPKDRSVPPKELTSTEYGEHKFAVVNGIKIHYVEKGDPAKPLMIFVHGFPEFWYSWRYQIKEFSKDYWTVAIDQRGYGDSDKPSNISDYDSDNMVEDIRQLVKYLKREKFILVAHDWGAVIGWKFVQKHMDMIDKYIMMGGPSSEVWRKLVKSSVKQFLMSWYIYFFQMPYLPEFIWQFDDYNKFEVIKVTKDEVEPYKYTFGKSGAITGPINYYRANIKMLFPDPPLPKPKSFAPGLFLLGEGDKYIAPESGPMLQKYYEKLDFKIVPNANHFLQQHKPEETNKLMRNFLEKK